MKPKRLLKHLRKFYARAICARNRPYLEAYDRIYHFHIRKSAGTSINSAFWGLAGLDLKRVRNRMIFAGNGIVFARNNRFHLEDGYYFYGNSHLPYWKIDLPERTFTFCVMRDPYARLVSLYRYYKWVAQLDPENTADVEPYYRSVIKETTWLGDGFSDFLDQLPREHRENQLYMFSESFDIDEAVKNIGNLNRIFFQDRFDAAIEELSSIAGRPLAVRNERALGKDVEIAISPAEEAKARMLLGEEIEFFDRCRGLQS